MPIENRILTLRGKQVMIDREEKDELVTNCDRFNGLKHSSVNPCFYHIGHSLKDLGKKLFAFSKMDVMTGTELISQL